MKTALIILAPGFEETEAVTIVDILRRGNIEVTSASLKGSLLVKGAHAIEIKADTSLADVTEKLFDAVILPGGMGGTNNLLASDDVRDILIRHAGQSRLVSAICAAPLVLEKAGLLANKKVAIYPGLEDKLLAASQAVDDMVVADGQIMTSKGPGTAMEFALALVDTLAGKMMAEQVAAGLVYRSCKN